MKIKIKVIMLLLVISILLVPYIYVEFQTAIYGKATQNLYKQTCMIEDNNFQKVFFYSDKKAKVLYADENNINMCTFHKNNIEEWSLTEWETIRSKQGSADSFIYPYYGFFANQGPLINKNIIIKNPRCDCNLFTAFPTSFLFVYFGI